MILETIVDPRGLILVLGFIQNIFELALEFPIFPNGIMVLQNFFLLFDNTEVQKLIFRLILTGHKCKLFPKLTLYEHADILMHLMHPGFGSLDLLTFLLESLNSGFYELFNICCYIATNLGDDEKLIIYGSIKPSDIYLKYPNWPLWPIVLLYRSENEFRSLWMQFLIQCSPTHWYLIMQYIEVVGIAFDTDSMKYSHLFLRNIMEHLLESQTAETKFPHFADLLTYYLFFPRNIQKFPSFQIPSRIIIQDKTWKHSPMYFQQLIKFSWFHQPLLLSPPNPNFISLAKIEVYLDYLTKSPLNHSYGLRLNYEGEWLDSPIVDDIYAFFMQRAMTELFPIVSFIAAFKLKNTSTDNSLYHLCRTFFMNFPTHEKLFTRMMEREKLSINDFAETDLLFEALQNPYPLF
jgi:hypothetical protein